MTQHIVSFNIPQTPAQIFSETFDTVLQREENNQKTSTSMFLNTIKQSCWTQLESKIQSATSQHNDMYSHTQQVSIITHPDYGPHPYKSRSRTRTTLDDMTRLYGGDLWISRTSIGFEGHLTQQTDRDFQLKDFIEEYTQLITRWLDTAVTLSVISVADYNLDHRA
jgi:hypothetical protein